MRQARGIGSPAATRLWPELATEVESATLRNRSATSLLATQRRPQHERQVAADRTFPQYSVAVSHGLNGETLPPSATAQNTGPDAPQQPQLAAACRVMN